MSTATTTTFEVSNVTWATEPLPEVSYKEAVEALLTTGIPSSDRQFTERLKRLHRSVAIPRSLHHSQSKPVQDTTGGCLPMSRSTQS